MYPETLQYTKEHEWVKFVDGEALVGITDFAQQQLGDVVYVELPEVGATLEQGVPFGSIESVKAVSELYAPLSGTVVRVNADLGTHPEVVNSAPHDTWMIAVAPSDPAQRDTLLDHAQYTALVE